MKKVISYSLFGSVSEYYQGIDVLVLAHHAIFKEYELRIHHDSTIKNMPQFAFMQRLHEAGKIKLVFHEEGKALTRNMMWRLLPLWDSDVKYLFTRDIDALPMIRDRAMIETFIQSGMAVHNIVDAIAHNWRDIPLMGGCMGFDVSQFRSLVPAATDFESFMRFSGHDDDWFKTYAHDEYYLRDIIWPIVQKNTMMHVTNGMPDCPDAALNIRNRGESTIKDLSPEMMDKADSFAPHVCSKWWDYEKSRAFYKKEGDPELLSIIYE